MATSNVIKTMVSKNKKRFEDGEFNLDLSYITDRIIAMGYPAQDIEKLYRNDARTVLKMLNVHHKGHYKLFNLCRERQYDSAMFEGRVEWEPFEDHKPPRIEQIEPFCRKVQDWLDADKANVVAIHCKAGKGRTGVMICCYLLYAGIYRTPREVLKYYGEMRTKDGKGVTIPSQRRYVEYFHRLRQTRCVYRPTNLYLVAITLEPERALESIVSSVYFSVKAREPVSAASCNGDSRTAPTTLLDNDARKQKELKLMSSRPVEPARRAGDTCLRIPGDCELPLCGDFKLELLCKPKNKLKPKEKLCWLWLNTFFVAGGAADTRTDRMERASSCPEEENAPPGQAYPIVSSCSDALLQPGVSNRITLTVNKHDLDKGCKDSRLPDSFKMHLSLARRKARVSSQQPPHVTGSDTDTEDDSGDEYPERESTHL